MTIVKGLSVARGETVRDSSKNQWRDDGRTAYRIVAGAERHVIPVPFVRECDARAAMNAIADMYDWTLPVDELHRIVDGKKLRQTIFDALAW